MSTILVIANDVYGPKLRSDLIYVGHVAYFVEKTRLSEVEISCSPDLVLLDVEVSEEDLGALCRALRDREAARRAPILPYCFPGHGAK